MERCQFGMLFSSFQTTLTILRKENPLYFSLSCFPDSLNIKNTQVYFLWTCKTSHWKTLMGLNNSFFTFFKYMIEVLIEGELYLGFVTLLKLIKKQRSTHPSWWGKNWNGKPMCLCLFLKVVHRFIFEPCTCCCIFVI